MAPFLTSEVEEVKGIDGIVAKNRVASCDSSTSEVAVEQRLESCRYEIYNTVS